MCILLITFSCNHDSEPNDSNLFNDKLPEAGNPDGNYTVPEEGKEEDTSYPDHVVGNGTPESCTAEAFVAAVAQGGIICFDCGDDPVTITLTEPAKIFNDKGPEIVIDGKKKGNTKLW